MKSYSAWHLPNHTYIRSCVHSPPSGPFVSISMANAKESQLRALFGQRVRLMKSEVRASLNVFLRTANLAIRNIVG